jgi:hypothetical protein
MHLNVDMACLVVDLFCVIILMYRCEYLTSKTSYNIDISLFINGIMYACVHQPVLSHRCHHPPSFGSTYPISLRLHRKPAPPPQPRPHPPKHKRQRHTERHDPRQQRRRSHRAQPIVHRPSEKRENRGERAPQGAVRRHRRSSDGAVGGDEVREHAGEDVEYARSEGYARHYRNGPGNGRVRREREEEEAEGAQDRPDFSHAEEGLWWSSAAVLGCVSSDEPVEEGLGGDGEDHAEAHA